MYAKPLPKQQHLQVVEKSDKLQTKIIPVGHLKGGRTVLPKPMEGYLKTKKHDPL